MLVEDFLKRLEAIRLRQIEIVAFGKTNPQVYERLVKLPLFEAVRMMDKVDQQLECEKLDETIKRFKMDIKNNFGNK